MIKPFIYLSAKLLALIVQSIFLIQAGADIVFVIISALAFACVFLVLVLLQMKYSKPKKMQLQSLLMVMCAVGCFFLSINEWFLLFIVILIEIVETFTQGKLFYQILAVSVFLTGFLFTPKMVEGAVAFALLLMLLIALDLEKRFSGLKEINRENTTIIAEKERKISQMKNYAKTLRQSTAMEERNRFSAKIHDKLGHGISGSIIMLEAAMLSLKTNPEQAEKNIRTATSNLRLSVDDIRISLREERPKKMELGLAEIKRILEEFKLSFSLSARLEVLGDLERISYAIWSVIAENLSETLTNMLKHSNGSDFLLKITVMNKVIRVEFSDNGITNEKISFGLGLEAIEERTTNLGGKMLVQNDSTGFSVVNIFMI